MPQQTPLTEEEKQQLRSGIKNMLEEFRKNNPNDPYLIPEEYIDEYCEEYLKKAMRDGEVKANDLGELLTKYEYLITPAVLSVCYHSILGNIVKGGLHLKYKWENFRPDMN